LIFHDGIELPYFAAFELLNDDAGTDVLRRYFLRYAEIARSRGVGVVLAAKEAAIPVAISFTVETDGRLPCGETLAAAIAKTDAASDAYPVYYMINCAHPTHFDKVLAAAGPWLERIRGLRANASKRSHAELDESADLDMGDPTELGNEYARLRQRLPRLSIVGGCCGTDHRHVEAVFDACAARG
jgi:S-methylmethionine-dependent homocysteine/selenocysteine methylase